MRHNRAKLIKPASYQKGGSATAEATEFGNHIVAGRFMLRDYEDEVEKGLWKTIPSVHHDEKLLRAIALVEGQQ